MAARLLVFSFLVFVAAPAAAEETGALRGFVTDSLTSSPLAFATVVIRGEGRGASTSTEGYYFIPALPAGNHVIVVSLVGYRHRFMTIRILPGQIMQVNIRLQPRGIELQELVVEEERQEIAMETELGLERITAREIDLTPANLEADIFRVVQFSPGVTMTGDVSARYYVRGGAGDQNLLLIDDAPVYNPFHALGILSVVDPEIISGLEFHKGGFGPQYSGRLSSVLNVVTRDGNKNRFGATAAASLLSAKLAVEGPIPDGSFLVAGRKSISAQALTRYIPTLDAPVDFYDLCVRATYANPAFDENGSLSAHGFLSSDEILEDDPTREQYRVRNTVAGLTWNKVWQSPLYSSVGISYSGLDAELLPNASEARPRSNTVRDVSLRASAAYVYDSRDELQFGLQSTMLRTTYALQNLYAVERVYEEAGWDFNTFVNYRFLRWEVVRLDLGMRVRLKPLTRLRPYIFEPRLGVSYSPVSWAVLKVAAGWYAQEVTTLTDETEVIAVFEPWIIVPDYLAAAQAAHFLVGIHVYPTTQLSAECEAYYKPMIDMIELNERKYTASARDFINVDGVSYGMEWTLRYQSPVVSFQASYALSRATRQVHNLEFTPRYDIRHVVNILAAWEPAGGWTVSATWSLRSGLPFTPIAGFYDRLVLTPDSPISIFNPQEAVTAWGSRNSGRLPVYHRLDISVAWLFTADPARITVGASIINVYDRKNIFYLDRDTGEIVYMLRFAPSLFVKVEL